MIAALALASLTWAHVANVAGQTADATTTIVNVHRGCAERNPLYGAHPSDARIVWTKTFVAGGVYVAMRVAEKNGNTRIAKVLGFVSGAAGGTAAVINITAKCEGK